MCYETFTDVMDFVYDQNGQPYALKYNGTFYFYVLNLQGDVVRIVDGGGTSYGVYRYDAWGNILYSTNNDLINANPLRYRGYYYDAETGFYYLQSRYYDPTICRFINADEYTSTGQDIIGYNMFAYCFNNPTILSDVSGDWPVIAILVFVGAVVLGALLAPSHDEVIADAEYHYSRNELNVTTDSIDEIMEEYEKQPESMDQYHENTDGAQGAEAIYNDKYLSPDGGHIEVIICSPPDKSPYIVDESVDETNMGTYNYASNKIPVLYHAWHLVADMVPYYLYGNTADDDYGLLKWAVD